MENEIIDLGFDVKDAQIERPVLPNGTYDFAIASVKAEASKSGSGGTNLVVGYKLDQATTDVDGKPVEAGRLTILQHNPMKPVGNMTQQQIVDRLGGIHFAATGERSGSPTTEKWVGSKVRCRLSLREARTDEKTGKSYDASNEIQRVLPRE